MKLVGFLVFLILLGGGSLLAGCQATDTRAMPGPTVATPADLIGSLPQDG